MINYEDDLSLHVTNMPAEMSPEAWPPWRPSYCLFPSILPFLHANTLPHPCWVELVLITLCRANAFLASCFLYCCLPLAISVTDFSELQLFTLFAPGFCTCWEGKQHEVKALSLLLSSPPPPPHSCFHLTVKSHSRSLSVISSYTRSSQRSQKR